MITIADLIVDAAAREEHNFEADVSEHPVETGAAITDHVRAKPPTVVIEGIVSDTPLEPVASLRNDDALPSYTARVRLFEIWYAREPVTIETTVSVYKNMVMQSFNITEDGETGEACRFRATFKQIKLITNNRTTVTVAVPNAKKKLNRGNKPSAEAPDGGGQSPPAKATRTASAGARTFNRISLFNADGTTNYQEVE